MPVAVVVGGSAGLGRAIVRRLADDGWYIGVLAREEARLAATVDEVTERGGRATSVSVDVADADAVEAAAARIERDLGPIELWVNGSITAVHGEFLDVDPTDFERVTDVTYHGLVNGTRAALSRMIPRDRGHVIQISSAVAHRGMPLFSSYCAAKAASRIFTESVVSELRHHHSHVRISQIDMPALDTPFYSWVKNLLPRRSRPIPVVFEPEVGARVVASVVRHPRPRTWVGESTVFAILGNRLAGGLMDRLVGRFGYRAQESHGEHAPMLPPNLHEPVPADVATRGVFGRQAVSWSPQVWVVTHRRAASVLAVASGAAVAGLAIGRRRAG
ncbi:SDR family oxidoreductase [Agromyces sp. NPDC049794]|uniref:SDR family oxidoreductase n=1 Tax=unclassified Agromyces TaxID=2639701 RepID=UPI0033D317C1